MWIASCWLCERVTCYIDYVDGLSHGQVPEAFLVVHHVERDVKLLKLLKVVSLVEHLRVELEELVAREIQTLQALN